jgi:hypothetical protein
MAEPPVWALTIAPWKKIRIDGLSIIAAEMLKRLAFAWNRVSMDRKIIKAGSPPNEKVSDDRAIPQEVERHGMAKPSRNRRLPEQLN